MQLEKHQVKALQKLKSHKSMALFYKMGSGKTLIMLEYIKEAKPKSILVVAPKYVCDSWEAEIKKWCYDFKFGNLAGRTATQRAKLLDKDLRGYFITPDSLPWLLKHRDTFTLIIVDEASNFKNTNTIRWKTLSKFKRAQMVLLTGTPTPNGLHEIYPLIKLISNIWAGKSVFLSKYFKPITMGHIVVGYNPIDKYVKDLIYEEVKDLVLVHEGIKHDTLSMEIPIKMDTKTEKQYQDLNNDYLLEYDGGMVPADSRTRLLQLCRMLTSGIVYDMDENLERKTYKLNDLKLNTLLSFLENSQGENIIIWYEWKASRDSIQQVLDKQKISYTLNDVEGWNHGDYRVFLANPKSYGYGINMQQGGRVMVWYDLTFSSETYAQANARLARKGQTQQVLIYHMVVKNTIDEYVMYKLKRKILNQEEFLQKWISANIKEPKALNIDAWEEYV